MDSFYAGLPGTPFILKQRFPSKQAMIDEFKKQEEYTDVFYGEPTRPSGRKTDVVFLPKSLCIQARQNMTVSKDDRDTIKTISAPRSEKRFFDHHLLSCTFSIDKKKTEGEL